MKTEWKKDISSIKPPEFQRANSKEWIQRKNIQNETNIDGSMIWTSELRFISNDVYENLIEMRDVSESVLQSVAPFASYYDGYKAAQILLGDDEIL